MGPPIGTSAIQPNADLGYNDTCYDPFLEGAFDPRFGSECFGQDIFSQPDDLAMITLDVAGSPNPNLSIPQKELLMWHWRLGHAHMSWIQRIMRPRKYKDKGPAEVRPVIPVRNAQTPSCAAPMCTACLLAKQKRRTTGSKAVRDRESSVLSCEHLAPGDCASVDQYILGTKGRLATSKGKEKEPLKLSGGMLAVDHASGIIFIKHQVSLRGGETLQAKRSFEQWVRDAGVKIRAYYTDNGIFAGHSMTKNCHSLVSEPNTRLELQNAPLGHV